MKFFFGRQRERQRTCNSDSTADLAELLRWVPFYLRFFSCPIKLNGKLFKNTSEFNSKVDNSSDGLSSVSERYTCIVIFFIEKKLFMTYSLLFDILNIFYLYFSPNKLRSVVRIFNWINSILSSLDSEYFSRTGTRKRYVLN